MQPTRFKLAIAATAAVGVLVAIRKLLHDRKIAKRRGHLHINEQPEIVGIVQKEIVPKAKTGVVPLRIPLRRPPKN